MHFLTAKTGGRKFQCLDRDSDGPLRSSDVAKLLTGESRPIEELDDRIPGVRRWPWRTFSSTTSPSLLLACF